MSEAAETAGRLVAVAPREDPYDVELESGIELTGHVLVPRGCASAGDVIAVGRGFVVRTRLGPDGGFRFSAVPAKVHGFGTWPVRAYARMPGDP